MAMEPHCYHNERHYNPHFPQHLSGRWRQQEMACFISHAGCDAQCFDQDSICIPWPCVWRRQQEEVAAADFSFSVAKPCNDQRPSGRFQQWRQHCVAYPRIAAAQQTRQHTRRFPSTVLGRGFEQVVTSGYAERPCIIQKRKRDKKQLWDWIRLLW